MFASLTRLIRFALQDFVRNLWLSSTTVVILTLTLASVQVLVGVNLLGRLAIAELESRVDLRVQFRPAVAEADVDGVRVQLQARPEITGIEQRSRAQVLEDFQQAHRGNSDVTEALTELGENPFGPELRIHLRRPDDFPVVTKLLAAPNLAERIVETSASDRAELTAQLTALTGRLRLSGLILSGLFCGITLLIIVNAMRIATYTRREEAAIMRLVGAPNWFIRTPFLIMGILASAIATLLTQLLTIPAFRALTPTLVALVGPRGVDVAGFFEHHWLAIAAGELLGLSLLTVIVSAFAIRRYLRV
jgi:cell division transport system permease protein